MDIEFTKMHGIGNDFVVINAMQQPFALTLEQVRHIADRRFGIGCDQLLVVEPATIGIADFKYRVFNADGHEVEQCGNGARCFAHYVRAKKLTDKTVIPVETASGLIELTLLENSHVRVNMGTPIFDPESIPFEANTQADRYAITVNDETMDIGAVSMGNPHAVLEVVDIDHTPVERLGANIEAHRRFPDHVNVGFMQVLDRNNIKLRVWERGAGETLACGTGACAAVVIGQIQGLLDETVRVTLTGGQLVVSWAGENHPVLMTGPASFVFEGKITL
ncbi:MAG: diaminopimelate epimerase [Gammaproteobacteria bacterium]